ncbi:mitotic checkpoint protein prcc protein [Diplodia corticola]|uniref:Mitotic checkpoint protein prcc protein n=1 Tax=Diplodia corticola TaxID=236234 RepID=A0A1J9R424_9PEZI|nr:mitotic checkpoint protein prcc protein [Diplodia corticola]OJD34954.1 mitotic checkpoint protein prcc protein [Diplodia corticola]
MGLVDYSDSEGSDNDTPPAPKPATASAATASSATASSATSKPAFQKVVDRSNPGKIRVNLPSAAASGPADAQPSADEPPAKRARTAGGAFSGFNSFLPAPKKSGGAGAGAAKNQGLRKGVSLKTSAAPGFSREPVEEVAQNDDSKQDDGDEDAYGPEAPADEPKPTEEVKLVGKPMMFKPLSVSNNAKKKKKAVSTLPPMPKAPKPAGQAASAPQAERAAAPTASAPKPKPKVSLFSISQEESSPVPSASGGEYQPLLYTSQQTSKVEYADGSETTTPGQSAGQSVDRSAGPQSLETIASDLNLTEAQRRQLFGRQRGKGGHDLSAISVANFNTDQEYAHNEQLRAAGETVQHNPVRSIAPGKHSLKQLINNATTQKDALEEHFASGKRNKKEAGSKYGW